jgi:hypothetical protein
MFGIPIDQFQLHLSLYSADSSQKPPRPISQNEPQARPTVITMIDVDENGDERHENGRKGHLPETFTIWD